MGMSIRTSLLVDRSPESGDFQQARITLDDDTVLDVRGHNGYYGPRFVVTEIDAQGASLTTITQWAESPASARELKKGWRTYLHDGSKLIARWLCDQIGRAVADKQLVLHVHSLGAHEGEVNVGEKIVASGYFGYKPLHLGVVVKIEPLL